MTKIYFSTIGGKLIDQYAVTQTAFLKDGIRIGLEDYDDIRAYAAQCAGIRKEVENPSVKYLIRRRCWKQAVNLYHDKHPELSFAQARDAVEKIAMIEECEARIETVEDL